jgi:hypothetical protein
MERRAAVKAAEALAASASALVASLRAEESPGSGTADPLRQSADDFLDGLAQVSRIDAQVAAVRIHLAGGYVGAAEALLGPPVSPEEHTAQEMSIVAEVSCALTVSERTGSALLGEAHRLRSVLPLTLAALEAGAISWQHARVMVDETTNLDPAAAAALEAHFVDPDDPNPARGCPAGEMTHGRFRAKARIWRERHHPDSIEQRHTKGVADRRVEYCPDRDGMAWISAYLPADQASGIWARTTADARALQGPTEIRTLTQLRADVLAGLLLAADLHTEGTTDRAGELAGAGAGCAGRVPSPKAQVLATVPVFALMGLTEEPATLDGYGPIPPSMARRLIADGAESFHRVLIDPRDGAPLEIGRTSYRITKALRQWLRLRDAKCPFPGCSNQSLDNDADHILAWADGGTTGISNLGHPCRRHHRLRHTSAWTPTQPTKNEPPGWNSPAGRHYQSEHPDWEPPHWPEKQPELLSNGVELGLLDCGDPAHQPGQPDGRDVPDNR